MVIAHRVRMLSTVRLAMNSALPYSGAKSAKRRSSGIKAAIICIVASAAMVSATYAMAL